MSGRVLSVGFYWSWRAWGGLLSDASVSNVPPAPGATSTNVRAEGGESSVRCAAALVLEHISKFRPVRSRRFFAPSFFGFLLRFFLLPAGGARGS